MRVKLSKNCRWPTMPELVVIALCAVLVVAFLRSQRSQHTPTVQPRISKEDLAVGAAVAKRYFNRIGQ